LSNPSSHNIAFKVKTTVPTSYLVKPHNGYIPPKASIEINITMQPTEYNASTSPITDKFLVSAFPLNSEIDMAVLQDAARFNKLWAETSKAIMQNQKLSVGLNFENIRLSTSSPRKVHDISTTFGSSAESPKTSVHHPEELLSPVSPVTPSNSDKMFAGFETPKRSHFTSFRESVKLNNSSSPVELNNIQKLSLILKEVSIKEEEPIDEEQLALEKKRDGFQARIDELSGENVLLDKRIQTLIDVYKQQDNLQDELTKENEKLLLGLKDVKNKIFNPQGQVNIANKKAYDIWQVLAAVIIGLILGYLLGPN